MIEFADWGMRGELAQIWQTCFDEPARPAKYFLNNYFRPENCLVYRAGGKIASVVYLLPAYIEADSKPLQAHYIYAAATLPQYRCHGYMAALLAWAALAGANRGDWYSVVLPANRGLYPLYEKSDYSAFFQARTVSVSLSRLCDFAESGQAGKTVLSYRQLTALRNSYLAGENGSVLWSEEAFSFAAGMGKVYGDRLICSRTDGRPAYALCRRLDANTCKVLEIMVDEDTLADLLACLICEMPAQTYSFRLPVGSRLFAQQGEKSAFGMIKPLSGAPLEPLRSAKEPYLGLALD
jgi:Predicted acetyltransferase involved in intracellular survival and related acetyltransferases